MVTKMDFDFAADDDLGGHGKASDADDEYEYDDTVEYWMMMNNGHPDWSSRILLWRRTPCPPTSLAPPLTR